MTPAIQQDLNGNKVLSNKERRQEKKAAEKKLFEVIHSFTRPLIVMPGYEDMPIPDNIKSQIQMERLLLAKDAIPLASETETMWYISTASLSFPLDHRWANILFYLTRNWLIKQKRELPDFLRDDIELEPYTEATELRRLREWLYNQTKKAGSHSQ